MFKFTSDSLREEFNPLQPREPVPVEKKFVMSLHFLASFVNIE